MPARAIGDAAAAPAVAGDDELAAREQLVRRADDPVDRGLAGAVAVVEEVLRLRLVDGDDREAERPVALERLQADDARGRLLGAADDVAQLLAAVAWSTPITSAPSSIVICGLWSTAASMCW